MGGLRLSGSYALAQKTDNNERLIIKYTVLVVSSIVLTQLLTATILINWSDLLTRQNSQGFTTKLGSVYLESGIDYLINIVFVFLLYKEMQKEKVKSIPILILTFFSRLLGIIFFFLTIAFDRFNKKQINQYE